jgi:hypothetical protein
MHSNITRELMKMAQWDTTPACGQEQRSAHQSSYDPILHFPALSTVSTVPGR